MALKKYYGSCHCKKVKYEVTLDLQKGTYRCNCTFCGKVRNWGVIVKPEAHHWLQGQEFLGDYQVREGSLTHHLFCKNCGVRMGTKGYVEEIGGNYMSVSISTLEGITHEELAALPVTYMDGLNNDWYKIPKVTTHL